MDASRSREHHLAGFLKGVPVADGANQIELRDWLERVQIAFEFIPDLTVIEARRELAKVASGSLLDALRAYTPQPPQQGTLAGLRTFLVESCVSLLEGDRRILELETYRQAPYQGVTEYVAQFRARVNRAYTVADMANIKIARGVLKSFINGLHVERARYDTAAANPGTVEAAFAAAIDADNRASWIRSDARMEEPMEVGAALPPPPPELLAAPPGTSPQKPTRARPDDFSGIDKAVDRAVSRQLAGIQRQMTELRRSTGLPPHAGNRPSATPMCFHCP